MRNCVITGGTGLIGKATVTLLLEAGWDITSVVHGGTSNLVGRERYREFVYDFSLASEGLFEQLPPKPEAVIHLVQSNKFRDFPVEASDIFNTNVGGTFRMLEYARTHGVKTFVLASSGGIYGFGDRKFDERDDAAWREKLGFYLNSKLCSEIMAESYREFMNVVVLRFFFVYGEYQKRTMLIPRLILSIDKGTDIMLQGKDGININPIYVEDAARAVYGALSLEQSCAINVAGNEVISLKAISGKIGDLLGVSPSFVYENSQARHLVADTTKMKALLGGAEIPLMDGIGRVIDKMREQGELCH